MRAMGQSRTMGTTLVMATLLWRLRRCVAEGRSDAPGPVIDVLGRVGLVGYGVVHLLVAWLALQVAIGVPGARADAQGAVGTLARTRFGGLALVVSAAGLVAFAVWQLAAAAVGFRWARGRERFRKRAGAIGKSVATLELAGLIVHYLVGRRRAAPNGAAVTISADLLALPAGQVLLGVVATVVLALAVGMVYTGVRCTFMGDLDVERLGPAVRRGITAVGTIGHLARAVALAVIGVLVARAAIFGDARRAGGLDAALRVLGETGPGSVLLVVVALGFAAYGIFCLADAFTRRA
jgi:Domain of Unknown Function (DUF1206)